MAETERNLPKSSGGGTVSNEENSASYFSNLPIGDLICTPFICLWFRFRHLPWILQT